MPHRVTPRRNTVDSGFKKVIGTYGTSRVAT